MGRGERERGNLNKKHPFFGDGETTSDFASKVYNINTSQASIGINTEKRSEDGHVNNQTDNWKFNFEKILHNASQDEVYETTANEIVTSVLDGYNGTVLCYG